MRAMSAVRNVIMALICYTFCVCGATTEHGNVRARSTQQIYWFGVCFGLARESDADAQYQKIAHQSILML